MNVEIDLGQVSDPIHIPRIQLDHPFQIPTRVIPAPLPLVDEAEEFIDLDIVRQGMLRLDQLLSRPIEVEIAPIKVNRPRKMRLAGIGLKMNGVLDAGFGQLQATFRMIVVKEIDQIVGRSELAVSQKKRRVARKALSRSCATSKRFCLTFTGLTSPS